jgi:hypothetical protein
MNQTNVENGIWRKLTNHPHGVVIYYPADGEMPAYYFELVGVFYIGEALKKHGVNAVEDYQLNGNPRKYWMDACSIHTIHDSSEPNRHHKPCAVFVATRELNPDSKYPLRSRNLIPDYRKAFPVLTHKASWTCFQDVCSTYKSFVME